MKSKAAAILIVATSLLAAAGSAGAEKLTDKQVSELSRTALIGPSRKAQWALDRLAARGNRDVIPTLVLALRYGPNEAPAKRALSALTGQTIESWRDAMLWQEGHPEIVPHQSFRDLKLEIFSQIDPGFLRFLGGERSARENMKIRLEEIAWGGVPVDGIPSLDNPKLIAPGEATYLLDGDLVFGVEINGDTRAYPLRIMGWHEMFNETIGGVPVALAYCTLCGAGILFETRVQDQDKPLVFGSSGFLYRSNKLMFDRQTDSLWNQFTGEPISGPLADSGIKLKIRPVAITSWADWKARNPDTRVLSIDTGYPRDYGSGVVYREYFASPQLMFPANVRDETVNKRKDYVFGIRDVGAAKAWPLSAFDGPTVINDSMGNRNLVLIGDAGTRTVRAYDRDSLSFKKGDAADRVVAGGGTWKVTEDALVGPDGDRLARVPGHVSYWFAWDGYLGLDSELYTPGAHN